MRRSSFKSTHVELITQNRNFSAYSSSSSSSSASTISFSHSIITIPTFQRKIVIILAIKRNSFSFSSCRQRIGQRRFFAHNPAVLATALLMLHDFQKTKSTHFLIALIVLICLTSKVTCLRQMKVNKVNTADATGTAAAPLPKEADLIVKRTSEIQTVDFCLDTEGERHGLFSIWQDSSTGCQCSCQSVGNVLVVVCDDACESKLTEGVGDSHSLSSQNDEPFASLVHSGPSKRNIKAKPKVAKSQHKSCRDENSGNHYFDGQSWVSSTRACAKCYCINGTADCGSSVLHCQSSCLPGQRVVSTGLCCEHKCINEPVVPRVGASTSAPCISPAGRHSEVTFQRQQCVDQRCQCINGNWFCIDTCTPLDELKCPPNERIFWDPFCCPRCKGTTKCTVTVATINWLEEAPMQKGLPRFVSVFTPEGEKEVLSASPRFAHQTADTTGTGGGSGIEKTSVIAVEPAQQLVTHAGRCVCTDGELRCSRPGSGVWHDTDCYYLHGNKGRYYARGEHWKAYNDECSDCQCLEGRRYTCARTPCSALFLCPAGKVPIASPADCCPSTCEDAALVYAEERLYHQPSDMDQVPMEIALETRQNLSKWPVTLSKGSKCQPLGDPISTTSHIFLPSESLVIIRRICVSLKCVCSSEGNWVCADYCIPCHGASTQGTNVDYADPNAFHSVQPLIDGCCPKCPTFGNKEELPYFGERYSVAITCFLALLALTPLLMIIACCVCLRYRQKLKKLRATELNQKEFHLGSARATNSAQSSLAVPLTISTNAEGASPPIRLKKTPTAFGGHNSIHQSLLFSTKLGESPLVPIKFWRLSASYSYIPDPVNPNFEGSTPLEHLFTATSISDNTSIKDPQNIALTQPIVAEISCNCSSISSSSPKLANIGSTATVSSLEWKSRLRRSSTQPMTHFFPQAWKTMLSRSAAGAAIASTLPRDPEVIPFSGASHALPNKTAPGDLEASYQVIHTHHSTSIDLDVISETV